MTLPGGSLRRAGPADLAGLTELWVEVIAHHASLDPLFTLRPGAEPEVRRLLDSFLRDPDAAIFVWQAPDGPKGFCSVRVDRAPPIIVEDRRAEICDIGVRASARRLGVGRALADAALGWVRDRGIARVEVRVAAGNAEGQAFWRALAFGDLMDVLQRRL